MFIVPMQNLADQGARKRCNGSFGASEHPCRDFVRVPGPAVSSFQSSARGQVAQQDTGSGCLEGSSMAEASRGGRCMVPSGGQHLLLHPKLPRTAKLLSSTMAEGLRMEVPKGCEGVAP